MTFERVGNVVKLKMLVYIKLQSFVSPCNNTAKTKNAVQSRHNLFN